MINQILKEFNNIFSQDYVILIFRTLILYLIIKIIKEILLHILTKRIKTSRNAFITNQRLSIIFSLIFVIGALFIWSNYIKNMITIISFISAGITIAIREIILNLFAGIFIKTKKPFKLEDRISIDGIKGDVVVINMLSFKILEVGDRINGEQSSGLIINIPNSFIFSKTLKNYTTAFKYIWDEIIVKIKLDSDLEKNKKEILEIVNENYIVSRIPKKMDKAIVDASLEYRIYYNHLTPIIYTKVVDDYIELSVRFLIHPKKARIVEDDIWTKIIKKYQNNEIDLFNSN